MLGYTANVCMCIGLRLSCVCVVICMCINMCIYVKIYIQIYVHIHVCVCLLASAKSPKSPKSKQLLQKKVYSARRLQKFGSVHGTPLDP